jgi:hypothetical protein
LSSSGILLREALRDEVHLRLRLGERDSGFRRAIAILLWLLRVTRSFGSQTKRDPRAGVVGDPSRRAHDADDAPRLAVEADVAADDPRIAAEAALPERVAEDDDVASASASAGPRALPTEASQPSTEKKSPETRAAGIACGSRSPVRLRLENPMIAIFSKT